MKKNIKKFVSVYNMVNWSKSKNVLFLLLFILVALSIRTNDSASFNQIPKQPTGELKIITTISIIADWATEVGDQFFSPVSIVSGAEDPHTYRLTPSEITMIGQSDLFIIFGLSGLEPWVQSVKDAFPSLNILSLANDEMMMVDPLTGDNNPHIWMSPIQAKIFVQNITDAVISLDFEHRTQYESNRDSYLNDLDELILRIENVHYNNTSGLKVVIHHPSFIYLLDLLGVERMGVIEEHEGSEPSAQHIQEIIDLMIEENISTIVTQPQIEENLIFQMARDTNAKLAKLTPLLGIEGASNYIEMIEYDIYNLLHPENVGEESWTIPAIIVGSSLFGVTVAILAYFRFRKVKI